VLDGQFTGVEAHVGKPVHLRHDLLAPHDRGVLPIQHRKPQSFGTVETIDTLVVRRSADIP
jgi:hypothetical protein